MPSYYLNPSIVLLSDLEFGKLDIDPGTGSFSPNDFLIKDFGSITNLSVSIDRTVTSGQVTYFCDQNTTVMHDASGSFFTSDTANLPSYTPMNNNDGNFHTNFTSVDGNGNRNEDSPEKLLRGAIFTILVKKIYQNVDTSQLDFTDATLRTSKTFFVNDETSTLVSDIITKMDSEFNRSVTGGQHVEYWSGFTDEMTIDGILQEMSTVPFADGDKLYVCYSLQISFLSGQITGGGALAVDQSNVTSTTPFNSTNISVDFVLGWVLYYSGSNGEIDNMGGPLENMSVLAYPVDGAGAVSTKPLDPPLISDSRGRTLIPPVWQLAVNDKFICISTNKRGDASDATLKGGDDELDTTPVMSLAGLFTYTGPDTIYLTPSTTLIYETIRDSGGVFNDTTLNAAKDNIETTFGISKDDLYKNHNDLENDDLLKFTM